MDVFANILTNFTLFIKISFLFTTKYPISFPDQEASNLFQFITGLDDVPISDDFNLQVVFNRSKPSSVFPEAVTCLYMLVLPLAVESKINLYSAFDKALTLGRLGFSE